MAGFDNIFEDATRRRHEERIVELERTVAMLKAEIGILKKQVASNSSDVRSVAEAQSPDGRYSHR